MTACPKRILMTCDAVGGVWRYALDLAGTLRRDGMSVILAVLGPETTPQQRQEARSVATLVETGLHLDWMVEEPEPLGSIPDRLATLAIEHGVDLVHLNLPSQADGFPPGLPVVAVSHSCAVTWFAAVRGSEPPRGWSWQKAVNQRGFERADSIVAPSQSHANLLCTVYGDLPGLTVIPNASAVRPEHAVKDRYVFAAGRWWDDGKNGRALDAAAPMIRWPVVMVGSNAANGQKTEITNALYRGELPHGQTMALMRRAAIVVSPSLYEPFGLAALEAARSGAALVLADIPTYRELWDGCALFFDPHDAHDLARQVNRLTLDERLRAALAAGAEQKAERYSLATQALAYRRLYADASRSPSLAPAAE